MKNRKMKGIICGVLALVMILGSSLAYFTDRASTDAAGTAGTVGIDLTSDINLLNEDGMDILNPGDLRDGSFNVENTGNKSIDVRTTIVLTSSVAMTTGENGQAEYELYLKDDVEFVEGKGWMPKDGAQPIEVRSISADGKTITYNVPEYILNGNEDFDERETEEGVTSDSKDNDFVLVFAGSQSGNDFQDSTVTIDVLVEAKQHRNTGAGWEIVAQESYVSGAINQDAVLEAEDAGNIEVNPPADPDEGYAIFMYDGQEHRVKCESGTYEELWDYAQNLVGSGVTLNIVINDNDMLYNENDAIATAFVQGAQIDIAILDLSGPAVTYPVQVNIETSNPAAFEGVEVTATVYKDGQAIDTWTVEQGEAYFVQGLNQWEMYDIKLTNNKTSDVAQGFFEASNDDPIIVTIPYEIN